MSEIFATVTGQQYRAAFECMAKNDVRYYLNGICIATNGDIVATNGHILFHAKHEGEPVESEVIFKPAKIPAAIETVELSHMKVNGEDYVQVVGKHPVTSSKSDVIYVCPVVDGRFPNHVDLYTNKPATELRHIDFDAKYLALLPKIFKSGRSDSGVRIEVSDGTSAALITVPQHPELGSLIMMPMRLGDNYG